MSNVGNILADFPAGAYTMVFWGDACARGDRVGRTTVPDSTPMRTLHARLRCCACDGRELSTRIVCAGDGGFRDRSCAGHPEGRLGLRCRHSVGGDEQPFYRMASVFVCTAPRAPGVFTRAGGSSRVHSRSSPRHRASPHPA